MLRSTLTYSSNGLHVDVIRKRVTRVGSGAYSIYLPKKWIDAWPPSQQEGREVLLHGVNDALLIVPAIQDGSYEAAVQDHPDAIQHRLISAYVRGHSNVRLTPTEGTFHTETQIRARDVLRHTDERIVAQVSGKSIGFDLDPNASPPFANGSDLLHLLASRVREVLQLAGEATGSYGSDPERALHAMQMLRDIHQDDVSRLWHQALRLVATISLPLETVSDFQWLDLCAAELHTTSSQCLHVVTAILEEWQCDLQALDYPRSHTLSNLPELGPLPPIAKGMLRAYRGAFEAAQHLLGDSMLALAKGDAASLEAVARSARTAQAELQDALFTNAVAHWGQQDPDNGARASTANRISHPVGHILGSIARLNERALLLLAAKPEDA